jgi:hypothetical protein
MTDIILSQHILPWQWMQSLACLSRRDKSGQEGYRDPQCWLLLFALLTITENKGSLVCNHTLIPFLHPHFIHDLDARGERVNRVEDTDRKGIFSEKGHLCSKVSFLSWKEVKHHLWLNDSSASDTQEGKKKKARLSQSISSWLSLTGHIEDCSPKFCCFLRHYNQQHIIHPLSLPFLTQQSQFMSCTLLYHRRLSGSCGRKTVRGRGDDKKRNRSSF